MDHSADYAKHAVLTPDQSDRVELTYSGGEGAAGATHEGVKDTPADRTPIIICNRHPTAELWIDFTYPDGGSPSSDIAPGQDNTFVIPASSERELRSQYPIWEVVLVSDEAVPYSVMVTL